MLIDKKLLLWLKKKKIVCLTYSNWAEGPQRTCGIEKQEIGGKSVLLYSFVILKTTSLVTLGKSLYLSVTSYFMSMTCLFLAYRVIRIKLHIAFGRCLWTTVAVWIYKIKIWGYYFRVKKLKVRTLELWHQNLVSLINPVHVRPWMCLLALWMYIIHFYFIPFLLSTINAQRV